MKNSFYFDHDYNARNDPKILELRSEFGMEGYGIYWSIIETLAEDNQGRILPSLLGGLCVGYGIPKERLLAILNYMLKIGLLSKDKIGYFSKRMEEHKKLRKLYSDKGREGAEKRWKDKPRSSPPKSPPNAKDRRGKDNKIYINNLFEEFYALYPRKSAKATALKAWNKLTEHDQEEAIKRLPDWINHKPFDNYNYPYPATFINQRRWEDDLFTTNNSNENKDRIYPSKF